MKRASGKEQLADAGKILQAEDHDKLVGMVLDWAKDDDRLRERLFLYAARRSGPDASAAAVERAFEKAVRVSDYADYREAGRWAHGVDEAIDAIEQLLADGQAAAVIELCESGLRSLSNAIQSVDDSGGHFAPLRDRLEGIHYRACQKAQPDPVQLAGRLLEYEMQGEFDIFFRAVERYSKILGPNGLVAYRELAEAEWALVPARAAKEEKSAWGTHFHITQIMESLARQSGDIEQLVKVKSRDLSCAYHYLQIAEVYREARRHEDALLWAEMGLKAFPDRTDRRLREFAAEEYHRLRRHDDAMKLMWAEFLESPYLDRYKSLERHAKTAGAWPEWRERAVSEIRLRIAKSKEGKMSRWIQTEGNNSPLVEILLYEGNPDEAWREALGGGCSDGLWLQLAAARESEHPEDAAPIYLKQADAAVAGRSDGRYEGSVDLLVKAASVMQRMGRGAEFIRQLDAMCAKHKIKRNFTKLVEKKRKLLYL